MEGSGALLRPPSVRLSSPLASRDDRPVGGTEPGAAAAISCSASQRPCHLRARKHVRPPWCISSIASEQEISAN